MVDKQHIVRRTERSGDAVLKFGEIVCAAAFLRFGDVWRTLWNLEEAVSIVFQAVSTTSSDTPIDVAKRCLIVVRESSRVLVRKKSSTRSVP